MRAKRVLGVLGAVIGTTVTFVTSAAAGALLHLDTAAARRVVVRELDGVLASTFKGKIEIDRLGHLGLDGVGGVQAHLFDPTGKQVAYVDGARAKVATMRALRTALFGKGEIEVVVSSLDLDYGDVDLDDDGTGTMRLLRAFESKDPSPPKPPDPTSRGLRLDLAKIGGKHLWVHGAMAPGAPALDVDADALAGRVLVASKETKVDVNDLRLAARSMPEGLDPHGDAEFHLGLPSKTGQDLGMEVRFDGDVGGIPAWSHATMDGPHVDAVFDLRRTTSAQVRSLVHEAPVYQPIDAHAEAHGTLPQIATKAHVAIGHGNVDVDGIVTLGSDGPRVASTVAARDIDLRAFSPTAPESRVGAVTEVKLAIGPHGGLEGNYELTLLPGSIGTNPVPKASLHGKVNADSVVASGTIEEPGAPIAIDATLRPTSPGRHVLDFAIDGAAADLSRIERLGAAASTMRGSAKLRAAGKVDVEGQRLDATLEADVANFVYDGKAHMRRGAVDAHVSGAFAKPIVDARVHAVDLAAAGYEFSDARLTAAGEATSPAVTAHLAGRGKAPRIDAAAQIRTGAATSIEDARLTVERDGVEVAAKVDRVKLANGALEIDGAVVEGLGDAIRAKVTRAPGKLVVQASTGGDGIDLARVGRIADLGDAVRGGRLAFAVDATLTRDDAQGSVDVHLEHGQFQGVKDANANVQASLHGHELAASIDADYDKAGFLHLRTQKVALAGNALEARSWHDAVGRAQLSAKVELARVAAVVPSADLPFDEMKGVLIVEGDVKRDSAKVAPELRVAAQTRGLVLAGKAPPEPPKVAGTEVVEPPPWRMSDVDVGLDVRVDATSGLAEVAARALDRHGPVAFFDAKSVIPYNELWNANDRARAIVDLENAPFHATLKVPRRRLDQMPAILGTKGMIGAADVSLDAEGTAHAPKIALDAHLVGARAQTSPFSQPTDTDLSLRYDGKRADADVHVRAQPRRARTAPMKEVLAAQARVNVNVDDLLAPKPGKELPWNASARATMTAFPLQSVGPLSDMQVKGLVGGEVVVEGVHEDGKVRARFDVQNLKVGQAKYTKGHVEAALDGANGLVGSVRLEQTDGFLDARAKAPLTWGAALAPSLDPGKPLVATVKAKHFRVAAFEPFVSGAVSELDGHLDADAQVALDPRTKATKMQGKLSLRDGVFELPAMGEELRRVEADVALSPDGTVRVDRVVAHGIEGKLTANAFVKLAGLSLVQAKAKVHIDDGDALPVALQGEELGSAAGDIAVTATTSQDGKRLAVNVDVPTLHMKLPPSSGNSVQSLDEPKEIRVGVHRQPGKLTKLALDQEDLDKNDPKAIAEKNTPPSTVMDVAVHLGNDVEIKRSTDVKIEITGSPKIHIAGKTEMSGQLHLTGGFLEVQGKRFTVEQGTVSFVGEPDNPEIVVTASWMAPDNTKVFADFVGPLKTGKVTLRSEPSRPKNEILALIMFGTAEGSQSTPYPQRQPDGTVRAVGMGGSFAAQGLNKGLEDLTGNDKLTAKIDTTESANPRPELQFQLTRHLDIGVEHVLGVPPIDQPDRNFVVADWRVKRNWSIEATLGDKATSILDAIWQYRY